MNNQEVFNKVRDHLLAQGEASTEPELGSCRYRGPRGLMCAVGALIADAHYSDDLEGLTVDTSSVMRALRASGVTAGVSLRLLSALQGVHDCGGPEDWPARLTLIASCHGLTP